MSGLGTPSSVQCPMKTRQNMSCKTHTFNDEARILYCLGFSFPDPEDVEEDSSEELVEYVSHVASAVALPASVTVN